jgi:hypothetical protein
MRPRRLLIPAVTLVVATAGAAAAPPTCTNPAVICWSTRSKVHGERGARRRREYQDH